MPGIFMSVTTASNDSVPSSSKASRPDEAKDIVHTLRCLRSSRLQPLKDVELIVHEQYPVHA